MKHRRILLIVFFLALFVFQQVQAGGTMPLAEKPPRINAAPANTNILFPTIKVYVYPLVEGSGALLNPASPILCAFPYDVEHNTYGCGTMNSNPDDGVQNPDYIDVENYYLKDVIGTEMNVNGIPPEIEALKAQALASRTVASWKAVYNPWTVIDGVNSINNSITYQAFIPGSYGLSSSTIQGAIDSAISGTQNQFLSAGDGHTIDAEFSSDMEGKSRNEGKPYLIEIQDPISTTCGAQNNGNLWGMSQKGAVRWARGNQCASGGDMPWPVKWNHQQILVHYYTGVDIVVDGSENKVAPDDRWNLLKHNVPSQTTRL